MRHGRMCDCLHAVIRCKMKMKMKIYFITRLLIIMLECANQNDEDKTFMNVLIKEKIFLKVSKNTRGFLD
jgi:hypothetical protein